MFVNDAQVIDNNFKYHAPSSDQVEHYQELRDRAKGLALLVNALCPCGREKALAMTKIEEAVMWANASIARGGAK